MKNWRKSFYARFVGAMSVSAVVITAGASTAPFPDHPAWASALKGEGAPITVYTARKIHTMDPGRPEATAIAVLDGKVLSTGTLESMQPWLSRYEHTVDESLKDMIVMPGFIEPHSHFWISAGFLGLSYIGPIDAPNPAGGVYTSLKTYDEVIERLRQIDREETDPSKPIIAYGYDRAQQGGTLNREILDKISTTRPIWIISFAPHFAYLNTPALKILETTGLGPDTDIHGVEKKPDGGLTGVFIEVLAVQAALGPVFDKVMELGGAGGLKFMGEVARAAGVTTTSEMTYGAIDLRQEWQDSVAAVNDPTFSVRLRLVPMESVLKHKYGEGAVEAYRKLTESNGDKLFVDGIKFLTDGSLPLMSTMVGFPGYLDGSNGHPNDVPWDQMADRMAPWWEAGVQIHCHANGDRAIDACLGPLADLQAMKPRFDHRFTIEHYTISTPMQARRLKALGGLASVNVYFVNFRSQLHSNHAYGPDRSEAFARLGSLEREEVIFGIHSDYPQVVVPMEPLLGVWTAVNRFAEDGKTVMAPGERIGVDRALRAVTIDAAYILGMEDKVGSLEPGKFADFAILEEDPYKVDPTKIKDIPVWGTALSGKLYKSDR